MRRLFRVVNGGTPTSDPENWNGSIPWATPVDLGSVSGKLNSTRRTITEKGVRTGSTVVPAGSILISTRAPIGYTAITGVPLAFNQGCRALVPTGEVDARFFCYQLESMKNALQSQGLGSTFLELSSEALAALPVVGPPLDVQRRIADFLDAETALVDALVQSRVRQLELVSERAEAYLSERLFPGILSSPLGKYPWPWLPKIPDNRPLVRLGYVCRIQGGVTVDSSRKLDGDVVTRPYLRVANVQADRIDLSSVTEITVPREVAARSTLRPGDVLMTEGGDIDKLGRGTVWRGELPDALHQNHVFALRPDPERLNGDYLAFLTRSLHGRCCFESTGVRSTNLASTSSSKVLSFPIPLPPLEQQRQAVADIRSALDLADQAKSALQRQLSLLAERRRSLITAAVTGQIDVTTARGADLS